MDEMHPNNNIEEGRIVLKNVASEAGIEKATGGRGLVVGPILGNDGKSDILFGNEGNYMLGNRGENFLFQNQGDGTFKDLASEADILDENENGRGIALGDFNRDGLLDIACGNWEGYHRIFIQYINDAGKRKFKNVASSVFSEPSMIRTVIAADFDNDGFTEIFLNNICDYYKDQPNKLFTLRNKNDKLAIMESDIGEALEVNGYGTGAAVADIDEDGSLELLVSHGESKAQALSVYKVNSDKLTGNNWIRIYPKTKYGAPARGALVKVYTSEEETMSHVIDGGSGYLCQMEPFAHFGTGFDFVVKLDVTWPDGKTHSQSLTSADRNTVITVDHPDSEIIRNMRENSSDVQHKTVNVSTGREEL
ncbi:hypothetical protein FSP39_013264 [Pinctada imbricata]|uniref:ASPIC/UnbV domain-containing protein n=1 Tax=Pinctada imbricata TaxID=66713 RepID=A0AA88XM90_PINIB|nr:hypothetical protein FSP39_013264 [Pinctada imbricata]